MTPNPVWPFTPQHNKPIHNQGDHMSSYANPVWSMEEGSNIPITPTHSPCGYWTKAYTVPPSSACFVLMWAAGLEGTNHQINSYSTADGSYLGTFIVPEPSWWNNVLAVDQKSNVYCKGVDNKTLRCYNQTGTLLYETTTVGWLYSVCTGPDGHVYTLGDPLGEGELIVERNPANPTVIGMKAMDGEANGSQALIMDSDKYIYLQNLQRTKIKKFDYKGIDPMPIVAQGDFFTSDRTFALLNGVLAGGHYGGSEPIKTVQSDLSAYITEHFVIPSMDTPPNRYPRSISSVDTDFLCCGFDNTLTNALVGRYKSSDGSIVWETVIGSSDDITPYQVAAYPF